MDDFASFFNGLCTPAKLYLVIVFINGVFAVNKSSKMNTIPRISLFLTMFVVGCLIAIFGNYLCERGYSFLVWVIVLLPLTNMFYLVKK